MKERSGSPVLRSGVGTQMRDGVGLGAGGEIAGGAQPAGLDQAGDRLGGHVQDVALAAVDHLDLFVHRVDADHLETGLGENARQRQADVAQSQDGDGGGFIVQLFQELGL